MSTRRKPYDVDHAYGAVRFVCLDGHSLGLAWKQGGRYGLAPGLTRVEGPSGEVKIKASCQICEGRGRYRDLQASWAKVAGRLDELDGDVRRGVSDYPLGG